MGKKTSSGLTEPENEKTCRKLVKLFGDSANGTVGLDRVASLLRVIDKLREEATQRNP